MGSQDARAGPRRPGIGLRVFTALVVAGLLASALPPVTGVTAHVIINEVLYDPPPGGHEWVELYNNESVGVSVDGWILTDEDDNDFVIPDIPDMPSGARIVVHFLLNGPNETAFGESEPGVLHLSAPFENVLDPVDQLALYSGPKSPSTIEDYVDWATGGPVAACTPTSLVSRAGEQYSDLNVDLAGFNNRLHAVWSSADPVAGSDSDWDIVGRDFGAPGWSPFDELNTPGVPDSRYGSPVLAAHAAGLYAFWETPRGGFPDVSDLNYSVHDGARWSDEQSVESGPANVTHAAPTAASLGGDLFVVWERTETATSRADDVVYKRLSGGNWSSLEYVSNAGDNSTDSNPVAGVFGGVLYVLWARGDRAGNLLPDLRCDLLGADHGVGDRRSRDRILCDRPGARGYGRGPLRGVDPHLLDPSVRVLQHPPPDPHRRRMVGRARPQGRGCGRQRSRHCGRGLCGLRGVGAVLRWHRGRRRRLLPPPGEPGFRR